MSETKHKIALVCILFTFSSILTPVRCWLDGGMLEAFGFSVRFAQVFASESNRRRVDETVEIKKQTNKHRIILHVLLLELESQRWKQTNK